jgi:ABC-type uncharacterized transport system substrate-binding protein
MKKASAPSILVATAVLVFAGIVDAQQPGKIFRIGYLDPSTPAGSAVLLQAFWQEMRKLGWAEEKSISMEYRFGEQNTDRLPDLATDLVRVKVDVIMTTGGPAALAAKAATRTIPVVMATTGDPVGEGLVVSLARPGGNVTGLSALTTELNTKRLEILKDAIPKLAHVGLLRGPGGIGQNLQLKEIRATAPALKLKLAEIETQLDSQGFENAFQTARQKQVNAILTTTTRSFFAARKQIVELAEKYRLPAIYFQREFVDDGGLMSYGTDFSDLFRRSAHYVDKILKGTKPGDLPVQQATKFEFVINLKAAKQIGLTIPPRVLERANQVIK